jgi:hypothetical protein
VIVRSRAVTTSGFANISDLLVLVLSGLLLLVDVLLVGLGSIPKSILLIV